MKIKELSDLRLDFEEVWSWDTAYYGDRDKWSPSRPSTGQCLITALVVQDKFGGDIVEARYVENRARHYFNILDDGTRVDFTADQFDLYAFIQADENIIDRKKMLRHKDVKERYELIKGRLENL